MAPTPSLATRRNRKDLKAGGPNPTDRLKMAKRAQIKGVPEDLPTKLKRWAKSEYYDQDKFLSNLVGIIVYRHSIAANRLKRVTPDSFHHSGGLQENCETYRVNSKLGDSDRLHPVAALDEGRRSLLWICPGLCLLWRSLQCLRAKQRSASIYSLVCQSQSPSASAP